MLSSTERDTKRERQTCRERQTQIEKHTEQTRDKLERVRVRGTDRQS